MIRYVNQRKFLMVKAMASASLIGLVSVGVAYSEPPHKKVVHKKDVIVKVSNPKLPEKSDSKKIHLNDGKNEMNNDSEDTTGNTTTSFNSIGFRVPDEYFFNKK